MMDLGSNNNFEEKAIKNSSPLLIKSAAHRGPAATPSQRGLQAAEKKGAPAPQKRRRCHQVEWSGPDLYTTFKWQAGNTPSRLYLLITKGYICYSVIENS